MSAQTGTTEQDQTEQANQAERLTAIEVLDSLSGFDEIAVRNHFGATVDEIQVRSGRESLRALAFVLHRRDGKKDPQAFKASMDASMTDVADLFADDVPEVTPDEPSTPAGNGGSPRAKKRATSSASS